MSDTSGKAVVMIGGGHAHALVLNALKTQAFEGGHITVINPGATAAYSGMLPGFVAGHYDRADLDINVASLCQSVGATFVNGKAKAMDPFARTVDLEDGTTLQYDIASLDVGITSQMDTLPGFQEHGTPAKPLDAFSRRWDAYRSSERSAKHVVIIGGGIAGAELAMAMHHALRVRGGDMSVTLLDRSQILSTNTPKTQRSIRKELTRLGILIQESADIAEVSAEGVSLADGRLLPASFVVGAAGATPHGWLEDTGLVLREGFVEVQNTLETSAKGVFAVGDCAHMVANPRPKAGVYAVRQAPVLLQNLANAIAGKELVSYTPQTDYLKLVSLGGKRAFGEKNGLRASGHLVWRVKDRIDRSFMAQF